MSAHILLKLLNELGKMILSIFPNEFNKLNNTRAKMQDSIYHMILILHLNRDFRMKMSKFGH